MAKMNTYTLRLTPIVSIIAGVLILLFPNILAWIVGLYLIVIGILDLAQ